METSALYSILGLGFGLVLWIIRDMAVNRLRLEMHSHDGVAHVHLTRSGGRHHNHQPVLVGAVHGLAGSAPVLALAN